MTKPLFENQSQENRNRSQIITTTTKVNNKIQSRVKNKLYIYISIKQSCLV